MARTIKDKGPLICPLCCRKRRFRDGELIECECETQARSITRYRADQYQDPTQPDGTAALTGAMRSWTGGNVRG